MSKCHECGLVFTTEDLDNASNGNHSPVGDYDWVCLSCQFKLMENGRWDDFVKEMLKIHNDSGKCNHK